MKASEFDARFDEGEHVTALLDIRRHAGRGLEARRVNVDFPSWIVESLDREAERLGVTRQALIKLWLADKLDHLDAA
jgi:hypothetical protein